MSRIGRDLENRALSLMDGRKEIEATLLASLLPSSSVLSSYRTSFLGLLLVPGILLRCFLDV
jgi:hypothetical protein